MIVVSSGARYIDIDAYACCVAYTELLNLLSKPALAMSTAMWNESITKSLRALGAPFSTDFSPQPDDQFVVMDLSDPLQFDKVINQERVIEIFDHHPGFEKYWADKLGKDSTIEFIGAAATLIGEQWVEENKIQQMSTTSAKLLAAAILDNTLNFCAVVTTDRDRKAYKLLAEHARLDDDWTAKYFTECQEAILSNLADALRNDTKYLQFNGLNEEMCLGQMVLWNAKSVIKEKLSTIAAVLAEMSNTWMANVVSISENRSYLVACNDTVKAWSENLLHVKFDGSVATANRLWLRKEIMKSNGL